MTTGRINQVTVLHARQKPHEAAGTRALAPSPARVSHRPIKSSLRRKKPQDTSPSRTTRPAAPRARVPSPPISHASEALPPVRRTRVGPFGEDYRRAAAPRQRASGTRRISEWLVADWIWPMGNQVHIPHHHPQQRQRRSARFALPGSSGDISSPPHKSQATVPSRAGTSCKAGASTARTRDGQPSPSGIHGHPPGRERGLAESTPVLPVVPAPPKRTRTPSHPFQGVSTLTTAGLQRRASARCTSSVSRSRPISRSQVTEQAQGLKLPSRRPSPIPAGRPPQANTRTPHQQRSQKTDTTGVLCTLSVLTLHVVGKYHFYQRLDWNVPGG